MEFYITQCDQCKKQIEGFWPKGWILIKKGSFNGRRLKEIKKANYCSFTCFQDFCVGVKTQEKEELGQEVV